MMGMRLSLGLTLFACVILVWSPQQAQAQAQTEPQTRITITGWEKDRKRVFVHITPSQELFDLEAYGKVEFDVWLNHETGEQTIEVSSGSGFDAVDAYTREKVSLVDVAKVVPDLKRKRLTIIAQVSRFNKASTAFEGYLCAQAVREHDWYLAANPEKELEKNYLYNWLTGLALTSRDRRLEFAMNDELYSAAWLAAIESCQKTPRASFVSVLVDVGMRARPDND